MKYHAGLLAPNRNRSRVYKWMRKGKWWWPNFPEDVRHNIAVWLATPGFGVNYHLGNLHIQPRSFKIAKSRLPGFEDLQKEVAENWMSVTREDAIKLCGMRMGTYACPPPLVVQMVMMDDLKAGMSQIQVARDFDVTWRYVHNLKKHGPKWNKPLPPGFELLLGRSFTEK